MALANTVKKYLEANGVAFDLVGHAKTGSSHETARAAHVPDDHIAKGVILKDEAGTYLMAVIPGSNWVRVHVLRDELDRALELAPEAEVDAVFTDCEPGAIPAVGPAYGIETIMDEALTTLSKVYFEAGDHQNLVCITGADFRKLLSGVRHRFFSHMDSAER